MSENPNSRLSAIKSGTASNVFLSTWRRTRKIVNTIVKPRPSFEIPLSCTRRQRSLFVSPMMTAPSSSESGWDAACVSTVESNNFGDDSEHLNVSFVHSLDHLDNEGVIGTTDRVYTLRRTKGNICSVMREQNVASSLYSSLPESRRFIENFTPPEPYQSGPKPLSPILEQADSPDPATGILSSTSSVDSLADSTIHFVDESSGVVFSRVQHASGACISAEQFVLERSSLKSSLSLHIGSPPACGATDLDAHIESLPSVVLTLPTPISPHSPIFSPEVHFTTEKFLNAAEAAGPRDRAPTLPQCDHGQEGKICRPCELQLLACRVWFQNADGGSRAALREPFVRPAQSTVRTRAVLASLGVGLGLANGWDESASVRDSDGDIDDPGSLAIEALPGANLRLVPFNRAIDRSRLVLSKLGACLRALSQSVPKIPPGNRRRKRRCG
ncbi:hypothetical protein BJV78DRAFT_1153113 [Lactifluus subvellereus]|nr:hypothetical protein BJV78DRAFT_1153113 [Lactifluus subvellereus]